MGITMTLLWRLAMPLFVVQTTFKKLETIEKQTKAMLEGWVNTNSPNEVNKVNKKFTNPFL